MYYLQSRYYDPTIGRFINADVFASTGQGFIGFNMFAYSGNNPILNCDVGGNRYIASTSVQNETAEDRSIACQHQNKIVQEKHSTQYQSTPNNQSSSDITAAFTFGNFWAVTIGMYNISGSVELAFDLKSNLQVNSSIGFDVTTAGSLSASYGNSGSIFFVPDTSYLPGGTSYLGGSVSVPVVVVPIDVTASANVGQTTDGYWGLLFSTGVAPSSLGGPEVHGGYSHTFALTPQINLIDILS